MSAVKVETQSITIAPNKIAMDLIESKRYEEYSNEVIEKITFEVVEKLKKSLVPEKDSKEIFFDDEELFDEIYDYMLSRLKEIFSSADIADIVNDICLRVEDSLFDKGLIAYPA